MDADHFDSLTRSLATPSRRGILSALAAAIGGAVLEDEALATSTRAKQRTRGQDRARASDARVAAEKRKKKKKKKKRSTPTPVIVPPPAPTCSDGFKNGSETDIDCGGSCPKCATGKACQGAGDCASGVCQGQVCKAPTCSDGVKNGSESDVDCGGRCQRCGIGKTCASPQDCATAYCGRNGTCQQCSSEGSLDMCASGAANPEQCQCDSFWAKGTCFKTSVTNVNSSCSQCPSHARSCQPVGNGTYDCFYLCGSTDTCAPTADYCTSHTGSCGSGGFCLRPVDDGRSRCGLHDGSDGTMCNCTSHEECERRTGQQGAFCAKISGGYCQCRATPQAGDTTFCVSPR